MIRYLAIDQYGQQFLLRTEYPRKELMERLGYKSAQRIYVDKIDGETVHTGWKVGPHWCSVWGVTPMEKKVST